MHQLSCLCRNAREQYGFVGTGAEVKDTEMEEPLSDTEEDVMPLDGHGACEDIPQLVLQPAYCQATLHVCADGVPELSAADDKGTATRVSKRSNNPSVGEEDGTFQRMLATTKGRMVAIPAPGAEPLCEGRAVHVTMHSTTEGTFNYTSRDCCGCNPSPPCWSTNSSFIHHADPAEAADSMNALHLAGRLPSTAVLMSVAFFRRYFPGNGPELAAIPAKVGMRSIRVFHQALHVLGHVEHSVLVL
jgi:hypothetical protein